MTLREKTIDNSVKCSTKTTNKRERERDIKPNTINDNSLARKQNKKFSQNNKEVI